jgi:hypothetical protein
MQIDIAHEWAKKKIHHHQGYAEKIGGNETQT